MRSEGYSSRSVCLFVCLSTTILALRATRRLMSDTNRFSATRAGKLMCRHADMSAKCAIVRVMAQLRGLP